MHTDQGFSWAGGTCGTHSLVPGALALGAQEHVSVAPVPSGAVAHALSLLIPLTLICSLHFLQGLQRSGAETGEQSRKKLAGEARAFVQKRILACCKPERQGERRAPSCCLQLFFSLQPPRPLLSLLQSPNKQPKQRACLRHHLVPTAPQRPASQAVEQ